MIYLGYHDFPKNAMIDLRLNMYELNEIMDRLVTSPKPSPLYGELKELREALGI